MIGVHGREREPSSAQRDFCTAEHFYGPPTVNAWSSWAAALATTHELQQCPDCRLWVIWTPHTTEPATVDEPALFDLDT